ncbi:uncharacterized protein RCC_05949 [Ramularia collo-cygni]|uniref:Uncharacterized protein n=1 Tax=Ramularia collo-cygni TaxID=112498 RepID=A0A2D3US45_9PEZI|nr:uncharacterized protein RCC_05949 [Ramularia collo-cygni]CZT20092.1 uncharacterized protein RCC_05949 [Ramularia collo-cygni]
MYKDMFIVWKWLPYSTTTNAVLPITNVAARISCFHPSPPHHTCTHFPVHLLAIMAYMIIGRSKKPAPDTTLDPTYGLQHMAAFETYVAHMEGDMVTALLSLPTREVDGQEIGDYDGAKDLVMPDPSDLIDPLQHCRTLKELQSTVQKHWTRQKKPLSDSPRWSIPMPARLVAASYTTHDPAPSVDVDDDASQPDHVHAAVTFVNDLGGLLRLPPSFTVPMHQDLNADEVRDALLIKFHQELPLTTQAQLLDKHASNPPTLHLWVMPQGLEHGQLYSWQSGPLSQFLSAAYIAANDRRLYLEARLAPIITSEMLTKHAITPEILSKHTINASDSEPDDIDQGLLSDESQSDSASSIITPDSDLSSSSRSASIVQVMSLPCKSAGNGPQCTILVDFDTTALPDFNDSLSGRCVYHIPLAATPYYLGAHVLRHACIYFRNAQFEMMRTLKESNQGLHMLSTTTFSDERDAYLVRDSTQSSRISKLSDIFLSRKSLKSLPEIPITIKISIIDLVPGEDAYDSGEWSPQDRVYAYHRIATAPPPSPSPPRFKSRLTITLQKPFFGPEEEVQLQPLQTAHVVRYPRIFPPAGPVVGIPCREINGMVIGDPHLVNEKPCQENQIWIDKYKDIEGEGMKSRTAYRNMGQEAFEYGIREGVPFLPTLTFLPFVGKGVVGLEGMRIHVAVRIVNSTSRRGVGVPMGVVVKVGDGEGMKDVICGSLRVKLREWYARKGVLEGVKLVDEGEEGKWRWDLWALPQKVGEEKVMYRFREGSLRVFLDEEMVERGVRTLYMEAHMVE